MALTDICFDGAGQMPMKIVASHSGQLKDIEFDQKSLMALRINVTHTGQLTDIVFERFVIKMVASASAAKDIIFDVANNVVLKRITDFLYYGL